MVHKLALVIGGVGAAAVLALAVVLGGFSEVVTGSADATVADQVVDDSALELGNGDGSNGKVKTVVDTIFIEDSSGSGRSPDASPDASPGPTASPSADDNGLRGDGSRDDDGDRHHGDDHDDDDDDHRGRGHGGDDDDDDDHRGHGGDDDRSGHRDGDDDHDRDHD